MTILILLALLNGVSIALARVINGRLSVSQGAFKASAINHFIGFLVLCFVIYGFFETPTFSDSTPIYIYLGGVIGALYVAINSFVVHRLGAVKAVLFVLSGQMFFSLFLDGVDSTPFETGVKVLGVGLILGGMYLSISKKS